MGETVYEVGEKVQVYVPNSWFPAIITKFADGKIYAYRTDTKKITENAYPPNRVKKTNAPTVADRLAAEERIRAEERRRDEERIRAEEMILADSDDTSGTLPDESLSSISSSSSSPFLSYSPTSITYAWPEPIGAIRTQTPPRARTSRATSPRARSISPQTPPRARTSRATKAPATKAPATKAPATKAPATKAPATKSPSTDSNKKTKKRNKPAAEARVAASHRQSVAASLRPSAAASLRPSAAAAAASRRPSSQMTEQQRQEELERLFSQGKPWVPK